MDEEQFVSFLKENLRIEVEHKAGCGETESYVVLYFRNIELSRSML